MGKPMGNGHPLAAVITTPEIATSFDTGMEYFNSFGGNPVSCAIGSAVLEILEQDQLQKHARELGSKILSGFSKLQDLYPQIGDVRGMGLFLGIELVTAGTCTPDPQFASALVESMKDKGVLLSTDGPQHNVIKFKPPMVFSDENAHIMLDKLQTTFSELT
jgi:4-aminobutyrate aminotransferase-like enzyme